MPRLQEQLFLKAIMYTAFSAIRIHIYITLRYFIGIDKLVICHFDCHFRPPAVIFTRCIASWLARRSSNALIIDILIYYFTSCLY